MGVCISECALVKLPPTLITKSLYSYIYNYLWARHQIPKPRKPNQARPARAAKPPGVPAAAQHPGAAGRRAEAYPRARRICKIKIAVSGRSRFSKVKEAASPAGFRKLSSLKSSGVSLYRPATLTERSRTSSHYRLNSWSKLAGSVLC